MMDIIEIKRSHCIRAEDLRQALGLKPEELDQCFDRAQIKPMVLNLKNPGPYLSGIQARQILKSRGYQYPKRCERYAFMMCKGGVGKTTSVFFLTQRLASYGARVLLIDADPQGNLTGAFRPAQFGHRITESTPVLLDVVTKKCTLRQAILRLTPQIDLVPSTAINSLLERKLIVSKDSPVELLDRLLKSVEESYDYILIDSAPTLNLINASIVYASTLVVLPIQLDEFSRMGLQQTMAEISDLKREFQFTTQVKILINKFSAREKLSFLMLGQIYEEYQTLFLRTTIRYSSELTNAIARNTDIFSLTKSKAGSDIDLLARELLNLSTHDGSVDAHH